VRSRKAASGDAGPSCAAMGELTAACTAAAARARRSRRAPWRGRACAQPRRHVCTTAACAAAAARARGRGRKQSRAALKVEMQPALQGCCGLQLGSEAASTTARGLRQDARLAGACASLLEGMGRVTDGSACVAQSLRLTHEPRAAFLRSAAASTFVCWGYRITWRRTRNIDWDLKIGEQLQERSPW
jgi:hypothetical protein